MAGIRNLKCRFCGSTENVSSINRQLGLCDQCRRLIEAAVTDLLPWVLEELIHSSEKLKPTWRSEEVSVSVT